MMNNAQSDAQAKYIIGIDVGGTSVKSGLFTREGHLLTKWEIPTRASAEDGGKHILPDLTQAALEKLKENGIEPGEVMGIGIGVPGPVDDNGVTPVAVNLHWGRVDIAGEVERLTGIHARAANDANVAALGEMWKGGGLGHRNLILVTIGTGIGGGIIVNERIVAGAHGAGGEIGHAHVDDTVTDRCNCGNFGCLEQMTSATGIVRLAREELSLSEEPSLLRGKKVSAKAVFDAVKQKDPLAIRVADRFGMYLGKALAVFACVCDPEVFVIGGGVSKAGPVILKYIEKNYRQYAFSACRQAKFELAQLGNDAGIYGAARLILQSR